MSDKVYYVNFNTELDFGSATDLGFQCSQMDNPKHIKRGMKDIEAKVAAGTIVPVRKGDDLRANPELGLYYIPVRIREVNPDDANKVVSGGGMLSPSGDKIAPATAATEEQIPS